MGEKKLQDSASLCPKITLRYRLHHHPVVIHEGFLNFSYDHFMVCSLTHLVLLAHTNRKTDEQIAFYNKHLCSNLATEPAFQTGRYKISCKKASFFLLVATSSAALNAGFLHMNLNSEKQAPICSGLEVWSCSVHHLIFLGQLFNVMECTSLDVLLTDTLYIDNDLNRMTLSFLREVFQLIFV